MMQKIRNSIFYGFFEDSLGRGRENANSRPPLSPFLTLILPPWSITAFFTIDSPSPVPPDFLDRPLSTL